LECTKQAILITAYKDFDQLNILIKTFNSNFLIYIHIDKKSVFTKDDKQKIMSHFNVKYISQKYKVNWGGFNHLKAYLLLSEIALKDKVNTKFHLITGQDFPIKDTCFFQKLDNKDYLNFFKMPATCWTNGGMDRLEYYNFYDLFNAKKSMRWISLFVKLQKKFKYKRSLNNYLGKLYGGSTYWSLSRETLQYVVRFTKENKYFFNRFKYTFCPEEIYFQTIILNSKFSTNVVNDNLRFIDWESGRGGNPAFLDETDLEKILSSKSLFARKINMNHSSIIELIKTQIHHKL